MLVDFNTAIQAIRNANLDMVELINQWKNLLSTTPADVAFTFADGSSVSFPNLAKLIAEYGSFPYNNLEFKVTDGGSSYHKVAIDPNQIILDRYASGQPGTTQYIKMINDGTDLGLVIYSYGAGFTRTAKISHQQISIGSNTGAMAASSSNIKFSKSGSKELSGELSWSKLALKDETDAALSKSLEINAGGISYEQAVANSPVKYKLNINPDQFFFGHSDAWQGGTRSVGFSVTKSDDDKYTLYFKSQLGDSGHSLNMSDSNFVYSSGYAQYRNSFAFRDGIFRTYSPSGEFEWDPDAGSMTFGHASQSGADTPFNIRIDREGIWFNEELKLPFSAKIDHFGVWFDGALKLPFDDSRQTPA